MSKHACIHYQGTVVPMPKLLAIGSDVQIWGQKYRGGGGGGPFDPPWFEASRVNQVI